MDLSLIGAFSGTIVSSTCNGCSASTLHIYKVRWVGSRGLKFPLKGRFYTLQIQTGNQIAALPCRREPPRMKVTLAMSWFRWCLAHFRLGKIPRFCCYYCFSDIVTRLLQSMIGAFVWSWGCSARRSHSWHGKRETSVRGPWIWPCLFLINLVF